MSLSLQSGERHLIPAGLGWSLGLEGLIKQDVDRAEQEGGADRLALETWNLVGP